MKQYFNSLLRWRLTAHYCQASIDNLFLEYIYINACEKKKLFNGRSPSTDLCSIIHANCPVHFPLWWGKPSSIHGHVIHANRIRFVTWLTKGHLFVRHISRTFNLAPVGYNIIWNVFGHKQPHYTMRAALWCLRKRNWPLNLCPWPHLRI